MHTHAHTIMHTHKHTHTISCTFRTWTASRLQGTMPCVLAVSTSCQPSCMPTQRRRKWGWSAWWWLRAQFGTLPPQPPALWLSSRCCWSLFCFGANRIFKAQKIVVEDNYSVLKTAYHTTLPPLQELWLFIVRRCLFMCCSERPHADKIPFLVLLMWAKVAHAHTHSQTNTHTCTHTQRQTHTHTLLL